MFAALFDGRFGNALLAGIERAAPFMDQAYNIVKLVAELTPTRADDEILAACDRMGVPAVFAAGSDKPAALRYIALEALKKAFPHAEERQLNRALEIAYGALKP
jgi:hypothetical protein